MNNPALVLDGILLLVIVISAIRAYSDGFFTAVVRLFGTLGSLFAGWYVADNYSQLIFDNYLRTPLTQRSYNYLVQTSRSIDIETAINSIIGRWPSEFVVTILEKAEDALSRLITPSMDSAVYLVDEFIAPLVTVCISAVLFVAVFIAAKIVCALLAKIFSAVNEIPVLGTANRLAGFVAGIAIGGVNIILLSFLMSIIVLVSGDSLSFLNGEIMAQSRILAFTALFNPFLS